jgi:hypothetical protein
LEQIDDDCLFGIDLLEYNNFSFQDKGKMNFKIQIVFEAGADSRFRKLPLKLEVGKLVFITGVLDLEDVELPFVDAKEIDLLDDFVDNQLTNFQAPFSRTQKFKNKNYTIKKEKISDDEIDFDKIDEQVSNDDMKNINNGNDNNEEEDLKEVNNNDIYEKSYVNNKSGEESEVITIKNHGTKREKELMDMPLKRSKMTKNDIGQKDDDLIGNDKKRISTRSQKQKKKEFSHDNDTSNE